MVKKIIFENGLRLMLAPIPGSLTSTVLVLVEAGSEYEPKEKNGIFHFLEHMCFKRTAKRPDLGMISKEMDALGAENNAFTSLEYTGFYAKAEAHKVGSIFEIISDMYLNAVFEEGDVEKERRVIIEEVNMDEDIPMRRVQDLFLETLYGDQPAGRPIHGGKENVKTLTKNDLVFFRDKFYVALSTVIVVSGNFDEKEIVEQVRKTFGSLPLQEKVVKPKTLETQTEPRCMVLNKKLDQTHLALGIRTFDIHDPRRNTLRVLADILGGGFSSRLFTRVREELAAAYYIDAGPEFFMDRGFLQVVAGVDNSKLEIVLSAIIEEMKRFESEMVPEAELQRAKDHLIGRMILGLETSDQMAEFYGGQEVMTGTILEAPQIIEEIRKVTAEDIRDLARAIFTNDKLDLAVIGPIEDPSKIQKVLQF